MAIKADHHQRALDICGLLHLDKSLDLAAQLARHAKAVQLADRIDELRQERIWAERAKDAASQVTQNYSAFHHDQSPHVQDSEAILESTGPRRWVGTPRTKLSDRLGHVLDSPATILTDLAPPSSEPDTGAEVPKARVNPFARKAVAPDSQPENYVNVMAKLTGQRE